MKTYEIYKNGTVQGVITALNKKEASNEVEATYGEKRHLELVEHTRVVFLKEKEDPTEIFAFFIDDTYGHDPKIKTCYAHVGQHSACHIDYANECKAANKKEYQDLKRELELIGYNITVTTLN